MLSILFLYVYYSATLSLVFQTNSPAALSILFKYTFLLFLYSFILFKYYIFYSFFIIFYPVSNHHAVNHHHAVNLNPTGKILSNPTGKTQAQVKNQ